MTAEQAVAAAASEGMALVRADNATSFKGVCRHEGRASRSEARLKRGGRLESLGRFATPEEAALAYARALGPDGSKAAAAMADAAADAPAPMTAEEALAAAASEGLVLLRSDVASGFRGVHRSSKGKPFKPLWHGGRQHFLGYFATAEEAALMRARGIAALTLGLVPYTMLAAAAARPRRRAPDSRGCLPPRKNHLPKPSDASAQAQVGQSC